MAGTHKDTIIRHIFLSELPEKWQQLLAAVSNGQSLEKLVVVADKMAGVTSEDVHIVSIRTRDSRSKSNGSNAVLLQNFREVGYPHRHH